MESEIHARPVHDTRVKCPLIRQDYADACDSDYGEWDETVAKFVEAFAGPILAELRQHQAELLQTLEGIELWSEEGREWKAKTELMHKRSLQLYIAKREDLERTFERAKIFL